MNDTPIDESEWIAAMQDPIRVLTVCLDEACNVIEADSLDMWPDNWPGGPQRSKIVACAHEASRWASEALEGNLAAAFWSGYFSHRLKCLVGHLRPTDRLPGVEDASSQQNGP